MIAYIYLFTLICNFICIIFNRKSRLIKLLTLIVILVIWCGNIMGPDIKNYMNTYNFGIIDMSLKSEKIFYIVMKIFIKLGMTFFQYRTIVTIIAFLLIHYVLKKTETNIHVVSSLYLLSVFFMDGIQIRNFLGIPFVLLGIYFMIRDNSRWRIKYSVCILIAGLIHSSLFAYFIFLLIPYNIDKKVSKKRIKLYIIFGILLYLCMFFYRNNLKILVILTNIGGLEKSSSYYTNAVTKFGSIIPLSLQILAIILSVYNYKKIEKVQINELINEKLSNDKKMLKLFCYINVFALYLVPFSIIQLTYYRLIRNLLIIDFIGIGTMKKWYKNIFNINLVNFIFLGIWIYIEYFVLGDFSKLVLPFFESNKFFT